jgi:hypothetical protein
VSCQSLWGLTANFPNAQIARPLAILVLHQLRRAGSFSPVAVRVSAAVDAIASAASVSVSASASARAG